MITEQEERVIILLKNTIIAGVNYHEGNYSAREAIEELLQKSEVVLHPEAIEKLIEWLKQSEL